VLSDLRPKTISLFEIDFQLGIISQDDRTKAMTIWLLQNYPSELLAWADLPYEHPEHVPLLDVNMYMSSNEFPDRLESPERPRTTICTEKTIYVPSWAI
jgi:hypothetical protein